MLTHSGLNGTTFVYDPINRQIILTDVGFIDKNNHTPAFSSGEVPAKFLHADDYIYVISSTGRIAIRKISDTTNHWYISSSKFPNVIHNMDMWVKGDDSLYLIADKTHPSFVRIRLPVQLSDNWTSTPETYQACNIASFETWPSSLNGQDGISGILTFEGDLFVVADKIYKIDSLSEWIPVGGDMTHDGKKYRFIMKDYFDADGILTLGGLVVYEDGDWKTAQPATFTIELSEYATKADAQNIADSKGYGIVESNISDSNFLMKWGNGFQMEYKNNVLYISV